MRPTRLLPFALLALSACVSTAPRMQLPLRVEADCESRAVKQTAIDAIVVSTDDTIRPGTYPGDRVLRKVVAGVGGAFAYWPGQPFHAPDTARALGVGGDYLSLRRAVVTNQVDHAGHFRPVWLTFATPHGDATVLERAYDTQNVCIEGQKDL